MPELIDSALSDDRVAEAFAQFRAGARTEILVPGSALARRTVGRRRHAKVGAIAAVLAVALIGGWVSIARDPLSGPPPAGPAVPSYGPRLSADELSDLSDTALGLLGYSAAFRLNPAEAKKPVHPGLVWGPATTGGFTFGTEQELFPAGTYELTGVCLGDGRVTVTWHDSGSSRSLDLYCRPAAEVDIKTGTLSLAVPGTLTFSAQADTEAEGRAAYAFAVSDPRLLRARGLLDAHTDTVIFGGEVVLDFPGGAYSYETFAPGRYLLTVACSGAGTVRATLVLDSLTRSTTVPCTWGGSVESVELTATTGGAEIWVMLDRDAGDTPNDAAVAYRLEKLT